MRNERNFGARIIGDRVVKVESTHVAQVVEVLLPDRSVEAKFLVVGIDHFTETRLQASPHCRLFDEHLADGVDVPEPGQEEVDGRGQPDDEEKAAHARRDISEVHPVLL
jgi:hypothetical protein